jgi:hypothetical protein
LYLKRSGRQQVELTNEAIDKAKKGSRLHGLQHIADLSEEVQEVLMACSEWNMETLARDILEADLPALQQKAIDLLESKLTLSIKQDRPHSQDLLEAQHLLQPVCVNESFFTFA